MIEQKILMWSLGFTVGVMTTIAVDKIVERDVLPPHSEAVRAEELNQHLQAWCQRCTEHKPGEL
jgi:hypothetical protein